MNGLAALLKWAWPTVQTVLHAALFIVATTIVFIEQSRSPALVVTFQALWSLLLLAVWSWQTWCEWRKGLLSLPLSQLHRRIAEGHARRVSLLEMTAILMGMAAMAILSLG